MSKNIYNPKYKKKDKIKRLAEETGTAQSTLYSKSDDSLNEWCFLRYAEKHKIDFDMLEFFVKHLDEVCEMRGKGD